MTTKSLDMQPKTNVIEENGLLRRIGNTPLVEIKTIFSSNKIRILAKLEWFNPGGSAKDRPAYNMIRMGEKNGALHPGKTIVDSTSGNTGIAYAMIAAAKGYKTLLAVPENVSIGKKKLLTSYGAELLLTDPLEGSDGSSLVIQELYDKSPEQYFYPDQYGNDANWQAHYNSTALEIYSESQQEITHFVAGLGTSGTFMGTSRRLKELDPQIQTISFMPNSPLHGLEGLKHMPSSIIPPIYDPSLADEHLEIATEEAQRILLQLAREEGLLAGLSSSAALVAALQVAKNIDRGTIVTVFPDSGAYYLSENF